MVHSSGPGPTHPPDDASRAGARPRFRVLGLLSIVRGDDIVVLPDSKPATVLASLLLRSGEAVSTECLRRAVWGDEPPPTARASMHTYVTRLRRLLAKFGMADQAITTVPGGYRLAVTGETSDLVRFDELTAAAECAPGPDEQASLLREALLLWQGPPLSNIHSDRLHRDEVPQLQERWLAAAERWFRTELAQGRCAKALPELRAAVRAHPGHEGFREQLIEALYRAGRQAEALAEYRDVKAYLGEELGIDPGVSLQELELAILRGADLGPGHAGSDKPSPSPSASPGPAAPEPPSAVTPVPAAPPHFTGRDQEVSEIAALLTGGSGPGPAVVVSGLPGIGKTALALRVAEHVRAAFPQGQWLVDATAVDGPLLREQLVQAGWTPHGRDQLLVFDGVGDSAQALELLAEVSETAALLTSRACLAAFAVARGAQLRRLGELGPAEGLRLLSLLLGPERVAREPGAVDDLAQLCQGVPMALHIVATQSLLRPGHRIADAVEWLRGDPVGRLCVGDTPQLSLPARLADFLAQCDHRLADACLRLARTGPADCSLEECAALLGLSLDAAAVMLDRLIEAGLLRAGAPLRYRVPELLRAACARCDAGQSVTIPEQHPRLS